MPYVIGVRFKRCGKIYDFEIDEQEIKEGMNIVVESSFGLTVGSAATCIRYIESIDKPLKKVIRQASNDDLQQRTENNKIEEEAWTFCLERIGVRGLPMKLIYTEVTLDRKRIVFYFTAEGRIDFRELVKDLASRFKTRIEMRQIGVRDEAKIIGGLGICGREVCCRTFLSNFAPISIRMAKRQDLVLNPGKLSGLCGRLMCCLGYECDDVCIDGEIVATAVNSELLDPNQEYVILEDKGSEFTVTELEPLNVDIVALPTGTARKHKSDYKKIDKGFKKEAVKKFEPEAVKKEVFKVKEMEPAVVEPVVSMPANKGSEIVADSVQSNNNLQGTEQVNDSTLTPADSIKEGGTQPLDKPYDKAAEKRTSGGYKGKRPNRFYKKRYEPDSNQKPNLRNNREANPKQQNPREQSAKENTHKDSSAPYLKDNQQSSRDSGSGNRQPTDNISNKAPDKTGKPHDKGNKPPRDFVKKHWKHKRNNKDKEQKDT
ncbi:MAG: hypothetical protein L3V56_09495 [Candidatus Magnetoovum sp. WYHC-5]|nr:hypothetical protein [Candidatus Magnetoovum sp. WYHC-5]